jgi:hypothetical protein
MPLLYGTYLSPTNIDVNQACSEIIYVFINASSLQIGEDLTFLSRRHVCCFVNHTRVPKSGSVLVQHF